MTIDAIVGIAANCEKLRNALSKEEGSSYATYNNAKKAFKEAFLAHPCNPETLPERAQKKALELLKEKLLNSSGERPQEEIFRAALDFQDAYDQSLSDLGPMLKAKKQCKVYVMTAFEEGLEPNEIKTALQDVSKKIAKKIDTWHGKYLSKNPSSAV